MRFKKLTLLLSLATIAFAAVGCSIGTEDTVSENNEKEVKSVTIKHELDEVTLDVNPEKVVVFDYGILDALDTMEVEVVALPKATLPEYLKEYKADKYTDVGTLKEPNFEKIYELQPDVIFISARQQELYEEFKEIAPTIYVPLVGENYLNSFKSNMQILGEIFEKEDVVNTRIAEIETAIKELNTNVTETGKNAIFIMANEGSMSVYGRGSRFGMLYDDFGFIAADENIESSTHGQKISYEYIIEKDPDYIFVLDRGAVAGGGEGLSAESLMNNDLMKSTKAYKEGNIVYVDSHIWYVASGGIDGTLSMVNEVAESLK